MPLAIPFGLRPPDLAAPCWALLDPTAPTMPSGDPWLPKMPQDHPRHTKDASETDHDTSKTNLLYQTAGGAFPSGTSWGGLGVIFGFLVAFWRPPGAEFNFYAGAAEALQDRPPSLPKQLAEPDSDYTTAKLITGKC